MIKIKFLYFLSLALLLFPFYAAAQDFDGSKPLIGAVTQVIECAPGVACKTGLPEHFDLPQFIRINFKEKMLTGKSDNQQIDTSPIEKVETQEGNLILHGSQNGRAWNIVISRATGKMTGTIAADGFSFTVFGACIAQ